VPTDLLPSEGRTYPEIPGYELLGVCGRGGMGVVYRARQLKANRLVALKMLRAVEHASATDRLRFQIEAEAVARLQHPHIVQLYEVGEVGGQPFFSLEFCDGGTLKEQWHKQQPTPREAAALIETLARAMHYAHLRGVVHRDLKPGNVLLAGAERVAKITDFGLAKRIDAEAREVSQSGAIMGTAAYMAPEQAAGRVRDTGPAADVYGLGTLLYEGLTGRPPFAGVQHEVLWSVLHDEPVPPSRAGAKVPADLETICLKCLRKEPARR
jgi:serine/threonine protein kinase